MSESVTAKNCCIKSTESSIQTRQCFMTGENCSQQTNIQKERQRLHHAPDGPEINAFVVMNFSSISDIVYESRIRHFIESLKQYLFLDIDENRIACVPSGRLEDLDDPTIPREDIPKRWKRVNKINVHRADSNPVSNYMICNRICQQMQTADLIIVDVSVETANVFYEFGLATAFRKLILPMCFSESFFEMKLPKKLEEALQKVHAQQVREYRTAATEKAAEKAAEKVAKEATEKAERNRKDQQKHTDSYPWRQRLFEHFGIHYQAVEEEAKKAAEKAVDKAAENAVEKAERKLKNLEKHIDCYPWRRKLFEHFGIRYQEKSESEAPREHVVRYMDREKVFSEKYGFSDYQYNHFPYVEKTEKGPTVGATIYSWLERSYNRRKNGYDYNTVVVYTMDSFLNPEQAGQCIVNFFYNITKPMMDEHCFCGDRVAILGQSNRIWDDPKDSKNQQSLMYSVSDLVRIGMNQATYEGERRRIKTNDYMFADKSKVSETWAEEAVQLVKTHVRNRCIPLNPETPIYVRQYQNGIQKKLDEYVGQIDAANEKDGRRFFCLYHVMLDTLRFANEIVVDLSSNAVQSLFWLGAAHGSNIYTVTVRHEMSEKEKEWSGTGEIKRDRLIFDIGGLWTAMLRYSETGSFYKQLTMIQQGIEQHSKLMLPDTELSMLEENLFKRFYSISDYPPARTEGKAAGNALPEKDVPTYLKLCKQKNYSESKALESYYRDTLWRHMLRDNQLHLFLPMSDAQEAEGPRLQVIKWDVDAVAELSHYLSKRKVIGKYQFDTLRRNAVQPDGKTKAHDENCICIGDKTSPFVDENGTAHSLAGHINQAKNANQQVRFVEKWVEQHDNGGEIHPAFYRGFTYKEKKPEIEIKRQYFSLDCMRCRLRTGGCMQEKDDQCVALTGFPQAIRLSWPKEEDADHFEVEIGEGTVGVDNYQFRFIELPEKIIHAQLHCALADKRLEKGPVHADRDIHRMLRALFPEGETLTLSRDGKTDATMLNEPNYTLQWNGDISARVLTTVLQNYSMKFSHTNDGRIIAYLCRLSQEQNSSGKANTQEQSGSDDVNPQENNGFEMPAQLLFWREQKNGGGQQKGDYKYHISLVGVSGPATKALTALLVDRDQKMRILSKLSEKPHGPWPLNNLQTQIREKFFETLDDELRSKLQTEGCSDATTVERVKFLVRTYLSTVLYRYFLPFLSRADEQRICNAMEAFLLTLGSKDEVNKASEISARSKPIQDALKDVLSSFRGVEAFYSVRVNVKPGEESILVDNRQILSIEEWLDNEQHVISCVYVKPGKKTNPEETASSEPPSAAENETSTADRPILVKEVL